MTENDIIQFALIAQTLEDIHILMQAQHDASEALRAQAEASLTAQEAALVDALAGPEAGPDAYPFVEIPAGAQVRELRGGGRLFTLPTGAMLRYLPADGFLYADETGAFYTLPAPHLPILKLPDGQVWMLQPNLYPISCEEAGVEGLPLGTELAQIGESRYRFSLEGGTILDVYRDIRTAVVLSPGGSVLTLDTTAEAIGEDVRVQTIEPGFLRFETSASGHTGILEVGVAVYLTLAGGPTITIKFPEDAPAQVPSDPEPATLCEHCGIAHAEVTP